MAHGNRATQRLINHQCPPYFYPKLAADKARGRQSSRRTIPEGDLRSAVRRTTEDGLWPAQGRGCPDFAEQALGRLGPIDVPLNNSGCTARKLALKFRWDDWNMVLADDERLG